MPMLMMDTGTPLYRPVMVVKPRSELSVNGLGEASSADAIPFAREGDPTVTCTEVCEQHDLVQVFESDRTIRLATSPERIPRW